MSLLTPSFGLLFWMALSFAIVFVLLAKFGFPVIVKMVDERRNYIQDSIVKADEANRKLEDIKQESDTIMNETRLRQSKLIKLATDESAKLVQSAKEQAAAEAKKQIEAAALQIESQKEKAMSGIREEVAQLSIGIAEKILRRKLEDAESQNELILRLLDEAEKTRLN